MKLSAMIAVALVVGIAAGALAANKLARTARDQRVAGETAQTPESRVGVRRAAARGVSGQKGLSWRARPGGRA